MKTYDRMTLPFLGGVRHYGGWLRWPIAGVLMASIWCISIYPISSLFAVAATLLLLFFFRCPRCIPPHKSSLASPATGRLDVLEKVENIPVCGGSGMKIGIFLSVFDVHITRSPITGRVIAKQYQPGRHGNAMSRNAGDTNQRNDILLELKNGKVILVRQISGAIARRVVFDPDPGDQISVGAIVGMIRFGSRVEVFVPENSGFEIRARIGERVVAGTTILGVVPPDMTTET